MLRPTQRATPRRSGFTLVELMVVIAIIAVLVSLIAAAVFGVFRNVEDINTRNDINGIQTGLSGFHLKFKKNPPSLMYLANGKAAYTVPQGDGLDTLREQSLKHLYALWPGLDLDKVDWSGGVPTSTVTPAGTTVPGAVLEGDQCLVFFLAGMNRTGFSNNPENPTQLGGTRVGPYLDNLDPGRLVATRSGNPFVSYLDGYRSVAGNPKPYFYFSAGLRKNGYADGDLTTYGGSPTYGVQPYVQSNGQYFNQDTYQIISAGRNQQFGPGGAWSPSDAEKIGAAGADDLTNFHDRVMGASK